MNSLRDLLFILLITALSPVFAQEKGIINDPDRYVNLREGPGTNYEVVDEIWEGQSFTFFRSADSNWWKVETSQGKEGYLHSSRIQPYHLPDSSNCQCSSSYGLMDNKPSLIAEVDGDMILACGYLLQRSSNLSIKISEFAIVRCSDDSVLWFYDATQTCLVSAKEDSLEVIELVYLPVGNGFTWKSAHYLQSYVISSDGPARRSSPICVLDLDDVSDQDILALESRLRSGWSQAGFKDIEDCMGQVAVGYMKGSNLCEEFFLNIESAMGFTPDGALAELYSELTAIVQLDNES